MDIPNHEQLLTGIDDFCQRHDLAETRFGRDAINNPNFIRGLREGVSPTLDTLTKVRDFMRRTDEEAATRAKLAADPPPGDGGQEEEIDLPFASAPVNPTGASPATCSSTSAPPSTPAASNSCPSCSADAASVAGPSTPTVAGAR